MTTCERPNWLIERIVETDSTSRYLRALAEDGAPHGTVVIAENQIAGHGRLGRTWLAPPGALLLSALIRPHAPLPLLSLAVAIAAAEAINLSALHLKWPNDLLCGSDKVGGILVEGRWQGDRPEYLIIGIGINVMAGPALSGTTCLVDHGYRRDATHLANEFLAYLTDWLEPAGSDAPFVVSEWSRRCRHWGQTLTVHPPHGDPWAATAERLDHDGALMVLPQSGPLVRLQSGEVSLTPPGRRRPLD